MGYDKTIVVTEIVTGVPCPDAFQVCFANGDCPDELVPYGECTQPSTPNGYYYVGKSPVTYNILISCMACVSRKCKATGSFNRHQSFYYNLLPTGFGFGDGLVTVQT